MISESSRPLVLILRTARKTKHSTIIGSQSGHQDASQDCWLKLGGTVSFVEGALLGDCVEGIHRKQAIFRGSLVGGKPI